MASVFDLGIGRALTRWIAELRTSTGPAAIAAATATALFVSAVLGAAVTGILCLVVALGDVGLSVSAAIGDEARRAAYLLVLGLGVSVYGSALRGGLEGFSDFRALNVVKIPAGVASFALPCLAATFTPDLSIGMGTLVASRSPPTSRCPASCGAGHRPATPTSMSACVRR